MAIGDKLFIADKETLDIVKTNTDTIITDTTTLKQDNISIKHGLNIGANIVNGFQTQTTDEANIVVNITGSGKLLGLLFTSASTARIQIDGNANRYWSGSVQIPGGTFWNLKDMGFDFNTSLKVTAAVSNAVKAIYSLT